MNNSVFMQTASTDVSRGDESWVDEDEKAKQAKIVEIAQEVLENSVEVAKAMQFCGTAESTLFNIQLAMLSKLAPSNDFAYDRLTLKDAQRMARLAKSIKEIINSDVLEYATDLYENGNY